ncbi:hypothetical protein [Kurthia sp. Dielmo]|uniref:hypothetical protein n=1 Tax=Kurthia sp. Dielmo TaxID=1033738 RepID=UPI00111D5460|nr:hypothetical protein [Kurthia sp. Dielmo]
MFTGYVIKRNDLLYNHRTKSFTPMVKKLVDHAFQTLEGAKSHMDEGDAIIQVTFFLSEKEKNLWTKTA